MKAILLTLVAGITLSASSLVIDNGCGAQDTCSVFGTAGGFGTTLYIVSMTAEGDVSIHGSGASGSVTLNDVGMVAGTGTGYIEFLDYSVAPYGPYDVTGLFWTPADAYSEASFSVGPINGTIPGSDMGGNPQPYVGTLTPFPLGTAFDITAAVSFDAGPYSPNQFYDSSGWATLDFSFSVYGPEGLAGGPLVIEAAEATVPEPGTAALGGLILVLMLGMGKNHQKAGARLRPRVALSSVRY